MPPRKKPSAIAASSRTLSRREIPGGDGRRDRGPVLRHVIRSGLGAAKVNILTWSNTSAPWTTCCGSRRSSTPRTRVWRSASSSSTRLTCRPRRRRPSRAARAGHHHALERRAAPARQGAHRCQRHGRRTRQGAQGLDQHRQGHRHRQQGVEGRALGDHPDLHHLPQ